MERYEMAELLAKKADVTLEEARRALIDSNWDLLDAMVALERACRRAPSTVDIGGETFYKEEVKPVKNVSGKRDRQAFTNGFAVLWSYIRKLCRMTVENNFTVVRRGKEILRVPVLVLIVLLFASFGLMLVVLLAGLFLGCQYHFTGRLGSSGLNSVMDKASDLAEDIKESFTDRKDR